MAILTAIFPAATRSGAITPLLRPPGHLLSTLICRPDRVVPPSSTSVGFDHEECIHGPIQPCAAEDFVLNAEPLRLAEGHGDWLTVGEVAWDEGVPLLVPAGVFTS